MIPQRFILGYFGVQSGHPSDLRDSTVDHLDGRRVREHLHGVVEQLRVVAERRRFRDGSIRGVTVVLLSSKSIVIEGATTKKKKEREKKVSDEDKTTFDRREILRREPHFEKATLDNIV